MFFHKKELDANSNAYVKKFAQKFGSTLQAIHNVSFARFVDHVTDPVNPAHNIHWYPQSKFCNIKAFVGLFDFVGNLEDVSNKAELFFKCTNTWKEFGSNGWGGRMNTSMFASKGSLSAPHATKNLARETLAPVTPKILEKVRRFYSDDYELNDLIRSPVYNSSIWEQFAR